MLQAWRNLQWQALWRERMFTAMTRNARSAIGYFNIPTNWVIELGTQMEI